MFVRFSTKLCFLFPKKEVAAQFSVSLLGSRV